MEISDDRGLTTFSVLDSADDWTKLNTIPPHHCGILLGTNTLTQFPLQNHIDMSLSHLFHSGVEKGEKVVSFRFVIQEVPRSILPKICIKFGADKTKYPWSAAFRHSECSCETRIHLLSADLTGFGANAYNTNSREIDITHIHHVPRFNVTGEFKCIYKGTINLSNNQTPSEGPSGCYS